MSTLRARLSAPDPQMELSFSLRGKYEQEYIEHRRKHPEVFRELAELARTAKARGWSRIGIRMLWEIRRWRRGPKPLDKSGFYLNDHMTRFYARDLMRECDDLAGMFEVRG